MTDDRILEKLKRRNEKALELLIAKYSAYVGTVVYNAIGGSVSNEDLEEVISDTFFAIWENAENIRELKTYMATVAKNKAINKLRNITYTAELDEQASKGLDETAETFEKKEMTRILYEAIEALGEPDCEIFFRYYYNNEKLKDIAKELDINASTVKSKLKRGKEKLCAYLSEGRDLI